MGTPNPSSPAADRRGKLVLLAGVLAIALVISWTVAVHGWHTGWGFLGVDWPGAYSVLDTRVITGAAESWAEGYDPLHENPHDPYGRPLNYPRVWQWLGALGIREADSDVLGAIFILLFLIGLFLPFDGIDVRTGLLLLLFVMSPAVLYGIERGNSDLVMFFLLALPLRIGRRNPVVGLVPILCAAVLKLYPVFALGYGLRSGSRRAHWALAAAAALFLVYCVAIADDLRAMRLVTEHSYAMSYGIEATALMLREMVGLEARGLRPALYGAGFSILAAAWLVARLAPAFSAEPTEQLDAFRIGAGVFCGSFVLASNWDYRLMFLYFAVPQLLAWVHGARVPRDVGLAAWIALLLVLIVVWRTGSTPNPHLAMTWVLFALLGYLFARALPRNRTRGRFTEGEA